MQPRLIEKWLPVNEISTEAIRERAAASALPPVNWLHVWWARRPLASSRASVLLSLVPQPADAPRAKDAKEMSFKLLGTSEGIHHIAQHLAARRRMGERDREGYGSHRRAFTHNPSVQELEWLKANLPSPDPVVLDVTAGGGSIPFEAGRLGLRAIANELNPVACHILRATCEWPQRYGYGLLDDYREASERFQARVAELLEGVYPEEEPPDCSSGECPHPQRGTKKHETVRAHRYVWSYLWARTVSCPSCRSEVPLSPNWRLDDKGTGMRVEPEADGIALRIVHDRSACSDCKSKSKSCHLAGLHPDRAVSNGTVARAIATCPACGSTTPKGHLAEEARLGRMGHRIYCAVYRDSWQDRNRDGSERRRETTCRVFGEPEERHFTSGDLATRELERLAAEWEADDVLPNEAVPIGNDQRPHSYGMELWVKMFNPRQQLAHGYCVQAFRECVDADRDAGRLDDRRKAAWGYVAMALDKMIHRNSLQSLWVANTGNVGGTFDRHDFGFKWSYAEMIAGGPHGYGLSWAADDIDDCLAEIIAMTGHVRSGGAGRLIAEANGSGAAAPAEVTQGDARDLPLGDGSVDCVVFDPPYEENVCYAELSDFFYVWLKRTAGYVFPEHFRDYLTDKDREAISSPARFKEQAAAEESGKTAKELALEDYQEKMAGIFKECRRVIKPDGVMTVMFNHKSTAAWDALTVGLIEAGFEITRTWPVKTEAETSMHIRGRAAARTTILLVCRPRERNPYPKPWHEVEELIARAVREDIEENLKGADLRPIDLYLSAFGPALRVISEHWGTERETGNAERPEARFKVTPLDALEVARREASRHREREISREWASSGPSDLTAKFYVLARDAAGGDTLEFDEANLLARAVGVRLDRTDVAMKGLVSFEKNEVMLLSARDRMERGVLGWSKPAGPLLDAVQTAVALTGQWNTDSAIEWLRKCGIDAAGAGFRSTLEALLRTTKPGHDDYWAQRYLWEGLYGEEPPPPAGVQGSLLEWGERNAGEGSGSEGEDGSEEADEGGDEEGPGGRRRGRVWGGWQRGRRGGSGGLRRGR